MARRQVGDNEREDNPLSPVAPSSFDAFVADFGRPLWQSLIPIVGPDRARDAAADALSYAWLHWDRIGGMANPRGYVYTAARRYAFACPPRPLELPRPDHHELPSFEPGLLDALRSLSEMQRSTVYLVEGCGWSLVDAAAVFDISVSTLRNHLDRGMRNLRRRLSVDPTEGDRS